MPNDKPNKTKKILRIVFDILTYLFFALCICTLFLSVTAKKDADGAVNLGGKQMRVVVSNSMEKCDQTDVSDYEIKDIPIKSMLFIDLVPEGKEEAEKWYADLKVGDVLTFRYLYVRQETITHRITKITPKQTGGYVINLEGDNKGSNTDTIAQTIDTSLTDSPNYVIGKVSGQSYALGLLVTAVKSPVGIVCIIIIPCVIIAIFEVVRLVNALTEKKREKERAEQRKKDEEFEELKRQLELLKKSAQIPTDETPIEADSPAPTDEVSAPKDEVSVPKDEVPVPKDETPDETT